MNEEELVDSKEVGLAVGLLFGKHFFQTEDLHYGYWSGLEISLRNLPMAQERHSEFVLAHIPERTETILDIGSGGGNFARKLLEKGFSVDCVSPSPFLAKKVRQLLGDRCELFECRLEDLHTPKRYDLALFSESFQYMELPRALEKCLELLQPEGRILICDFFHKSDVPGVSPLGGGHPLTSFYEMLEGLPLLVEKDIDITAETAPTMDVFGNLLTDVALPIRNLVARFLAHRHPMVLKYLNWQFRKRFEKLNRKYFSGMLNGQSFREFKSYRLIVLKKSLGYN